MFKIYQIDHVAITVADVNRSADWYCDALGGKRVFADKWDGEPVFIQIGSSSVAIFSSETKERSEAGHARVNIIHFAFKTDALNFKKAREFFAEKNIKYRFADHEVCHSVYLADPDGHLVEITTYDIIPQNS